MGLGLGFLDAAAGAGKGLEDLIAQRRAQQLLDQSGLSHLLQIEGLMQNRASLQQDREEKAAAAREKMVADQQAKADALKQRNAENVDKIVGTFSPGKLVPMDRFQVLQAGGGDAFPSDNFSYEPSSMGKSTPEGEVGSSPEGMRYGGSFSQLQKIKEDESRSQQNEAMNAIRQQLADAAQARADKGPTQHFTPIQEYDETGKPTTSKAFDTSTGRAVPIAGIGGAIKPQPGAAQAAQQDKTTKDALGSLDQLDQAIDAAAPYIGPGAGRVSHLEQLVGNPDPKISALGTKLLLTKMRVDHAATGTVRAGASPALIARWDNLLSQNLDPQNLKASVQAMREILGGGANSGIPQVGGMFNGRKVLKVEKIEKP